MQPENSSPMESILMTKSPSYRRPASAVVTLPDPDNAYSGIHVEIGGTLEIRCESPNYPNFQVIFDGADPSGKEEGHVFEGSIHQPIVIPVIKEGDFSYTVLHYHRHGGDPFRRKNDVHSVPCKACTGGTNI